ncbi:U-box domain-containing protein 25 [Rhynchospora pubera]|uniref:U-box domain-containing protein n=1 Tax=Rhynchospora pubera TaxID=906938 RepID=A0AAV8H107_9POAL|nr:U-box domain-containing protein 25 [Rhynchospora pubera]
MELMEDPVTVATGVTYDRKSIERWLFVYKKGTCPATMQSLEKTELTPNKLLKHMIDEWQRSIASPSTSSATVSSPTTLSEIILHEKLISALADVESSPFKMASLRTLKACMENNTSMQQEFVRSGGIQTLAKVVAQAMLDPNDFTAFQACEEVVGVLSLIPLTDGDSISFLLKPKRMHQLMVMLQRGSFDARLNTITILTKLAQADQNWIESIGHKHVEGMLKSLLEVLSDEATTKLSAYTLDLLLEVVAKSKIGRLKAIETGAVCVLIELLPDSARHQSEQILLMLKRLCECAEGRAAFSEHRLGIASVAKKMLRVSELGTKLAVKILWLVCSFYPTERILDEMLAFGAVEKLIGLLHIDNRSSTKEKVIKMVRMHGTFWRQYPCFPCELRDYLKCN